MEKARFSWMILAQEKGYLEFQDLKGIFKEIAIVWNSLTGESLSSKNKYLAELFNTLDIDQDHIITFKE